MPDESRTNVYKLYRATRTGPDLAIDPSEQIAFYVSGIGTPAPGKQTPLWRRLYDGIEQGVGQGLKQKISECYAAIISVWRPGDQIYLFGFSRGAYTVEMLGSRAGSMRNSHEANAHGRAAARSWRPPQDFTLSGNILYFDGLGPRPFGSAGRKRQGLRDRHACQTGADTGGVPYLSGLGDGGGNRIGAPISKTLRPSFSKRHSVRAPCDGDR